MVEENRKLRKPVWMNFTVVTLLLVTSGFILSACQNISLGTKSPEKLPENQPAKTENQKSNERLKKNQPTKSAQKKAPKKNPGEDTTDDDDPE